MTERARNRETLQHVIEAYSRALERHLFGEGEKALQQAYELGRKSLRDGMGILEMALVHHETLDQLWRGQVDSRERARIIKDAQSFFMESLTPFEMALRGFREANVALQRLNERLEEEARRIAHSLHDEVGQLLASVYIALQTAASQLDPPHQERLEKVQGLLDRMEEEVRRLSHELRPTILDDLGLVAALEFLAEGFSRRTGLEITVESRVRERFPAAIETALYRVTQEALNNVNKHARAGRVSIRLERHPEGISCSIRDDGVGFNVEMARNRRGQGGLGLIGIRERLNMLGGTLEIHSRQGEGTELIVTVPVAKE